MFPMSLIVVGASQVGAVDAQVHRPGLHHRDGQGDRGRSREGRPAWQADLSLPAEWIGEYTSLLLICSKSPRRKASIRFCESLTSAYQQLESKKVDARTLVWKSLVY